jgi:hypothetical protein
MMKQNEHMRGFLESGIFKKLFFAMVPQGASSAKCLK